MRIAFLFVALSLFGADTDAPAPAKTVEQQLAEARAQIADQSKQLQFYAQENAGCEARLARAVAAIPQQKPVK